MSIWHLYSSFHSSQTIGRILKKRYKELQVEYPEKKSFENCYTFIYFLKHAENYYKSSEDSSIAIKPVLIFYGISQLLKALLLTVDVDYPSNSAVLSHGVSTRKRKKQRYNFLEDEIKIQKNGLYGHVARYLFQLDHAAGKKFSMFYLLKRIPELSALFQFHLNIRTTIQMEENDECFIVPKQAADHYCITTDRLSEILSNKCPLRFLGGNDKSLYFSCQNKLDIRWKSTLLFDFYERQYYLPSSKDDLIVFPEILVHYLVLYNLSMISRYETEWWYDLIFGHESDDFVFIKRFLDVTTEKIPWLAFQYFMQLFGENE